MALSTHWVLKVSFLTHYLYRTMTYTYYSMKGLSEGGGEGVYVSDGVTQLIEGKTPGLIV